MLPRPTSLGILATLAALVLGMLVGTPPAHAADCMPAQSSVGLDVVLTFDDTSVGGCQWTPPAWVTSVRVLVVGGGGGGGVNGRGGGGGGGVDDTTYAVTPGVPVTVTVGAGGTGAAYDDTYVHCCDGVPGHGNQYGSTIPSTNGGNSSFGGLVSLGGGRGSGSYGAPTLPAGNGGSGGGCTGCATAGTGTAGQGYNGSTGGGGGGAGSAGSGGNGGSGKSSDITGVNVGYGGGGGVGTYGNPPGGSATDGGGAGGTNAGFAGAGVNGRGGGGGGGGYYPDGSRLPNWSNDLSIGGRGGNGVVIVRYRGRLAQSIAVAVNPNPITAYGTATLSASGYLGTGAITYAVASGPSICAVSGSTLRSLAPGTCSVTATIALDDTYQGATSAPVDVTINPPPQIPPGPPYLAKLRPGNRQIGVDWSRPDYEGTAPITEYRVYAAPGGQVCTVKANGQLWSTCLVTNLTNGKPYEFWVTAVNAVGESLPSRRLIGTPRPDLPSAPIITSLTPGNEQATASWNPPASDGGGTISEYRVYDAAGARLCTVPATSGPPYTCVITGLKNSTSYRMRVTAVNESGEGPPSEWRSVIPNPVRPGPPQAVVGRAGNFKLSVSWKPPADEGTYPVESYQVWFDGTGVSCTVTAPDTSCEIPDLVPGKSYGIKVRAWSKAGWGNLTSSSLTLTPPAPNIGYPEVRRNRKHPEKMTVTTGTTGIKPGTRLYTLPPTTNDEYDRPVVREDGSFIWKATVPLDEVWYLVWCTDPFAKGLCSPRTLLIDPYFTPE